MVDYRLSFDFSAYFIFYKTKLTALTPEVNVNKNVDFIPYF